MKNTSLFSLSAKLFQIKSTVENKNKIIYLIGNDLKNLTFLKTNSKKLLKL